MATVAVSSANREEIIRDGVSILYFTADWCPPCQQFGPIYKQVSDEFPEVAFGKIDVDANPDLSAFYGIRSIPTMIVHRDGKPIRRERGALGVHDFRSLVKEAASA